MRDRLIALLEQIATQTDDDACRGCEGDCVRCTYENVADYLLANGVIVPPCKVGDTVYYLASECDGCKDEEYYCYRDCKKPKGLTKVNSTAIKQFRIRGDKFDGMTDTDALASTYSHDFYFRDIGKTVFLTQEDAERALKEREKV